MKGKRQDLVNGIHALELGEYGKDEEGMWWAHVPAAGFSMARISLHDVVEHEDGTITVSPSILMDRGNGQQWHGYLERGIWREV